MISGFRDEYSFLSNFYPAEIKYNGLTYYSNECAYQAQKTNREDIRKQFTKYNSYQAKKMGKKILLREDWNEVKDQIMFELCLEKFKSHPNLAKKLIETGNEYIVEENTWGDKYWGVCNGEGENRLGKILMIVRSILQNKYY